jgi:hypothetical protein
MRNWVIGVTILTVLGSGKTGAQSHTSADLASRAPRLAPLNAIFWTSTNVHRRVLASAEAYTDRILHRAGIEVRWTHCQSPGVYSPHDECGHPVTPDRLELKLIARCIGPLCGDSGLGFSVLDGHTGKFPYRAYIFYDEVRSLATLARVKSDLLLGHVIAHEIGHLLSGSNRHTACGIMKANWDEKDLILAAQGLLIFDTSDAGVLRRSIITRTEWRQAAAVERDGS